MANRKKKKEIPVTGILAAVVIILLLCAGVVIWLWAGHSETGGQRGESSPEQTEATGTVTATEAETAEDDTGEVRDDEGERAADSAGDGRARYRQRAGRRKNLLPSSLLNQLPDRRASRRRSLLWRSIRGIREAGLDMSDQEPSGPGSSEMKAKASTGTQRLIQR